MIYMGYKKLKTNENFTILWTNTKLQALCLIPLTVKINHCDNIVFSFSPYNVNFHSWVWKVSK